MARMYSNQASGLTVVTGEIKSISEDRQVMTVASKRWNQTDRKEEEFEMQVQSAAGFDEASYRVGYRVTAIGYPHGKNVLSAERVLTGNETYETQDLTILRGYVKFARFNEEKDRNGQPIINAKGQPRAAHFDVTISVKDESTGNYVDHTVKIYNGKVEEGKKGNMDRAIAIFKEFDREKAPMIATFVTGAGSPYTTKTEKDGKEYVNFKCSYLGYKLMDVERVEPRERAKAPAEKIAPAPAQETPVQAEPTNTAPSQNQPAGYFKTPAHTEPATGFDAPEIDLEGAEDEFV